MTRHDNPNIVTLTRLAVGVLVTALIASGTRTTLAAALLLHTAIVALDLLDGRLARAAGAARGSFARRVGGFLDGAIDGIVFSIVAIALMHQGLITDWATLIVIGSRMMLMTVRGAAALGDGSPLGPTRLTKISGGTLGIGSLVVLAEAIAHPSQIGTGPTSLGIMTSLVVSAIVGTATVHYVATVARETIRSTITGIGGVDA